MSDSRGPRPERTPAPLPAEALGLAPGRGRLAGRRILVVGAGTRTTPEPDAPIGNGRAISVLCAREGAAVACADVDEASARATRAPSFSTSASVARAGREGRRARRGGRRRRV